MVHFWLRAEVKPGERRTPLLPDGARELIATGHKVSVERSDTRCFADKLYEEAGCTLVEAGTWPKAPGNAVILGLKELPESDSKLTHVHTFFGHAFKFQAGWTDFLYRFALGNGKLYDLEYLNDANGRRVAAFGRCAGFVGAAAGLLTWAAQHDKEISDGLLKGPLEYFDDGEALVQHVRGALKRVIDAHDGALALPRAHVIGALGRCGGGAVDLVTRAGVECVQWDMAETAKGGPFAELLDSEVLINCILLDANNPPPPFVTKAMLDEPQRRMTVLVDVSCDASNPTNPVPIYNECTTIQKPVRRIIEADAGKAAKVLDIVAIDHLPALLAKEASVEFATPLLAHLKEFGKTDVWAGAEKIFKDKLATASREVKSRGKPE